MQLEDMVMPHNCGVDRESCISAVRVRGRLRFFGRGHSGQASMNAIRAGPISAPGVDQDLVDHRDFAVAPDLKQKDLARGGDPGRERRDVHLMGNQDNGFRGRQAEQELPECGGLRAGSVPVPEERVQRGQVLDRTEVEEPGRIAAAAPLAGEDPVDGYAAARIAAPIFRACSRPCVSRLRWVVQSSSANVAGSPAPGAKAWRRMATMPGSGRWAKRASAAVGNGERKKAATRAARSKRVIGGCVRRSGDQGRLDETSAPIRKLLVMLSMHCAG